MTYGFSSGNLQELDLSFNKIEVLPEKFLPWSLKTLNLSNNQIKIIYTDFNSNKVLRSLDLSNNFLEGPSWINLPDTLKALNLSNNYLTGISIRKGQIIESLKINNNDIKEQLDCDLKLSLMNDDSSYENNPICNSEKPFKDHVDEESKSIHSRSIYVNRCYKCGSNINSNINKQCEECGFYVCNSCGSCFCGQ